jgi:plasmid replication initiation protein
MERNVAESLKKILLVNSAYRRTTYRMVEKYKMTGSLL